MFIDNLLKQSNLNIMKGNEEQQQQQLRNAQMGGETDAPTAVPGTKLSSR